MKLKKLLEKTERLFNATKREEEVKKKNLRELIAKLQKYEDEKEQKLRLEEDAEVRGRLQKKIHVAKAQIEKGEKLLEQMGK